MVLRKLAKERREAEAKKKVEAYFAGDPNPIGKPNTTNPILNGKQSFVEDIQGRLEDYVTLKSTTAIQGSIGGRIPDKNWFACLSDDKGKLIELGLRQKYQTGKLLHYAEAIITYDPAVAQEDVDVVRRALTDSGLARRV